MVGSSYGIVFDLVFRMELLWVSLEAATCCYRSYVFLSTLAEVMLKRFSSFSRLRLLIKYGACEGFLEKRFLYWNPSSSNQLACSGLRAWVCQGS